MPNELYLYTTPREADVVLHLDSNIGIQGQPCEAHGRDDAHLLQLPPDTPSQGGVLEVRCEGYVTFSNRGIVDTTGPRFVLDDVRLAPVPPPSAPPSWNADLDPFATIQAVYEQGDYDLTTKEGCGEYTEACCLALFQQQSPLWSHIKKEAAQNQWNGHAVDAIQLLAKAGSTENGIYDIVWSTESPDAKPAWSYKGPADPNLWMSPVL